MEFDMRIMEKYDITAEKIVQEVESVGFEAELLETIINN